MLLNCTRDRKNKTLVLQMHFGGQTLLCFTPVLVFQITHLFVLEKQQSVFWQELSEQLKLGMEILFWNREIVRYKDSL